MRRGAQAVDRAGVVVEGERDELVERRRVEPRGRQRDDEEVLELAGADADRPRVGGRAGLGELDQRADDRGDEQPLALGGLLRVGAQRGGGRRGGEQAVAGVPDRDLDGRGRQPERLSASSARPWRSAASSSARRCAVAAAARRPRRPRPARRRGRSSSERARAARRGRAVIRAASIAAWKASRAGSPWTAKTIRSSCDPPARWRRTSSTSIRAASSIGKPPTPVPNATSARLRAPSSSARRSVDAVERRMISADVGPPSTIVAAWMTQRHGIAPPEVSTASPSPIGAAARDSASIAGPPARAIAAATPPPCSRSVLAALAIASTSSAVMSASSASMVAIGLRYPHDRAQAGARPRAGPRRVLPRFAAARGRPRGRRGLGGEPLRRDRRGGARGRRGGRRPARRAVPRRVPATPTWSGST